MDQGDPFALCVTADAPVPTTPAPECRASSAMETADISIVGSGMAKTGPPRRQKVVSLVALLGALTVSAGILILAYEEYWIFFWPSLVHPGLGYSSVLTIMYQLDSVGYGFLGAGVLLFGASWTMARVDRSRRSAAQSVFDRYRTNWGVGVGTLGYSVAAVGLLVEVVGDAGQLAGVTIIPWPVYYPVSEFITGIGIAVWAVGAFLNRVSST